MKHTHTFFQIKETPGPNKFQKTKCEKIVQIAQIQEAHVYELQ